MVCPKCLSVNHTSACVLGKAIRKERKTKYQLCTAQKPNGKVCGNKALSGTPFCHCHADGRKPLKRSTLPVLFHILHLYGMRDAKQHVKENVTGGKHKISGKPPLFKAVSQAMFQSQISNVTLRSHNAAYKRWLKLRPECRSITFPQLMTAIQLKLHHYYIFNKYTLPLLVQNEVLIPINGIRYCFTPHTLLRMDKFPFVQDGLHLLAFDGFKYDEGSKGMVPTVPAISPIQQDCLRQCGVTLQGHGQGQEPDMKKESEKESEKACIKNESDAVIRNDSCVKSEPV